MKTLYNTQTQKAARFTELPYMVDGSPGILPDHIVELEVFKVERPTITDLQKTSMAWVADIQNLEYRQEWTVTDLTDQEIADKRNQEADFIDNQVPSMIVKELMRQQVEATITDEKELVPFRELYPTYRPWTEYSSQQKFFYMDKLWKVITPDKHTSQPDWKPELLPGMYAEIAAVGEYIEWNPQTHWSAYEIGDLRSWNGAVYSCKNPTYAQSYEPDSVAGLQYGWTFEFNL